MSAELPHLRINRQVVEGRGQVTYTFSPDVLHDVLEQLGAKEPADLSQNILRDFCRRASHAETVRRMEEVEKQYPGGTAITIDEAGTAEVRSSDVGFDTMMRFAPEADDETDLLCDPQYSPVDFDLRVFDKQSEGTDPAQNIGHSVLRVVLEPPSLA